MPPKYLKETVWIMSIFNASAIFFVNWNSQYLTAMLLIVTLIVAFSFYVLLRYWQGRNWARILVMLTSVLALFNLSSIGKSSYMFSVFLISEALLAVFLLWWLNTNSVKQYFKRSKEISQL